MNLFGAKDAGEGVRSVLGGIGDLAGSIRRAWTGELPPEIEQNLAEIDSQVANGQIAVNKIEAQHASLFVAGWRPFIGWVCGVAFALYLIVFPCYEWFLTLCGLDIPMPVLHLRELLAVMGGILGFGIERTLEKIKGVVGLH